uniref:Uncharacterized protein n=1 Tax=Prolemur simus TaxID=1328070 RepID=A0A8C9DEJ4_PROSS
PAQGGGEEQRAAGGARAGGAGAGAGERAQPPLLVGVRQRQAAAQHLRERPAELLRRHVVQQRVDHRAEVEERVREGQEGHVRPEVGPRPVVLGFGRSHDPPNLVGHPANGQGHDDQPWAGESRGERDKTQRSMRTKYVHM